METGPVIRKVKETLLAMRKGLWCECYYYDGGPYGYNAHWEVCDYHKEHGFIG